MGALDGLDQALLEHPELAATAPRVTAAELEEWQRDVDGLQVVDVRNPTECEGGMVDGAVNLPLPNLLDRLGELDPARPTVVYCAGGYRAATAASLLRAQGFGTVADVYGGYGAVCPVAG